MADRRYFPPAQSDLPMHGWFPYSTVHHERIRAHEKHHDKPGGSMEMKDHDDPDWLPVLVEELGEVARVLCEHRHGNLTDDERDDALHLELVQVAAMSMAWIEAIHETTRARALTRLGFGSEQANDVRSAPPVCPACGAPAIDISTATDREPRFAPGCTCG